MQAATIAKDEDSTCNSNLDSNIDIKKVSTNEKSHDLTEIEKEILLEEPLKDKKFYEILIYWISMCNFHGGFNQIFFSPF